MFFDCVIGLFSVLFSGLRNPTRYMHNDIENINNQKGNLTRFRNKSKKWTSELEFLLIEHQFIKELIHTHFLDICQENMLEEINSRQKEIEELESKINILMMEIHMHEKQIAIMMNNNQTIGFNRLKETHKFISNRFNQLSERSKLIKSIIYDTVKDLVNQYKQKQIIIDSINKSKAS